jgi:3-oxoacyl-[acyl-carrier-protein] synthase-1/3-oxoacyl-[acyl-carrier-protein] synthase II
MITRRRVAVTGVGLVTPVGNDVATTWDALLAGRSGGAEISLFDASGFSTHIAAEVKDFRNTLVTDRKLLKFTNRSHRFMLEAAEQALRDAGIRPTADDAHRWGCAVGAGMMTADFDDLVETHAHCAASSMSTSYSPTGRPTIRWCSAAGRRPRDWRC